VHRAKSVTFALTGFSGRTFDTPGLFNLMRNGGAIDRRFSAEAPAIMSSGSKRLGQPGGRAAEFTGWRSSSVGDADPGQCTADGSGELAKPAARQSLTLAFNDVFRVMA
jgi:DHA2 family multidrug resistance protein